MKYLFALLFFTASFTAIAQEKKEIYCEIVATQRPLSNKVVISIDYGAERKFFQANQMIKDEATGKVQAFNSVVDALNYMGDDGWKLAQAYIVTVSNQNVYHYLLKKEIE